MSSQMSQAQRNVDKHANRTAEKARSALDNISGTVPKTNEEVQQQIDAIASRGQQYAKSAQQQAKEYKGPAKSYLNTLVGYVYLLAGAGAGLLAGSFFVASNLLQSLGHIFEQKKEQAKKQVKKST